MTCPHCQANLPEAATTCTACGSRLENVYAAPRAATARPELQFEPIPPGGGDEAVATIIPYKNPAALIAYYLGLFSCLPVLGFPMAIVALVLAFKGFKARRLNPNAHGTVHAWIGLICGGIGFVINGLIIVALGVGLVSSFMQAKR